MKNYIIRISNEKDDKELEMNFKYSLPIETISEVLNFLQKKGKRIKTRLTKKTVDKPTDSSK